MTPYFISLGNAMNELFSEFSEEELETILTFVTKSIEILNKEVNK